MTRLDLRGLRGLVGLSLLWAVMWIPLGLLAGIVESLAWSREINWSRIFLVAPALVAIGAVSGFLFGVVFHLAERRRSFGDLSLPRMAVWSLVAAAAIPGGYALFNGIGAAMGGFLVYGCVNALCAVATLAIARRARSTSVDGGTSRLTPPNSEVPAPIR